MMSKKRFLFLTAVLSLITGFLSAGGSRNRETGQDADKPMVITTMGWQYAPIAEHPKMIEYWNKMFNVDIRAWNADNTQYTQQLNLHFAANEIPDFFRANLNDMRTYHEQQILAEIPEGLMREKLPNIVKDFTETMPDWLRYVKIDGKIYMLPGELRKAAGVRNPLVYRGDWIKNVGLSGTPGTLAEFEELVYRFTNNDPDRNNRKDTYGLSSTAFEAVYGAYGYMRNQWHEKNGQLVYSSIQPEMKEALGVLAKWYQDGVIDPEFITGENKGGYWALSHSFIEGRIGVSSMGMYYHWYIPNESSNANYNEMLNTNPEGAANITYGEPVTGPEGKKGLWAGVPMATGDMFAVGIQLEKDPAKMAKIFEMQNYFWESDQNYLTAYYGIRGEDWDYGPLGNPVSHPDKMGNWGPSQGAHVFMLRFRGNQDLRLLEPVREPFLQQNNFYSNGISTKLIVPLPSAGIYQTELNKIEDEAYLAIITGERPLSYFDQFVVQWKASGGDVLYKEANDWWNSMK
jgi:putative aldouronate transport system substrate-binding protein